MRKDPLEIMMEIMKALERRRAEASARGGNDGEGASGGAFSINELSQETGIHNVTIRKYVRIIEVVRSEPSMEVIKTKHAIILRIREMKAKTELGVEEEGY